MRKITDLIYVGGISAGERYHSKFDSVVNVSKTEYETETNNVEFIPLTDGENDFEDFALAVDAVRTAIQAEEQLLVHCEVGASRSVTVLSTALAVENKTKFDDELYRCQMNGIFPPEELLDLAEEYIAKQT